MAKQRTDSPMRILCPQCDCAYDIQPEALGANGRMVRCADCGNKWFQEPQLIAPTKIEPELDLWAEVEAEEQAKQATSQPMDEINSHMAGEEPPVGPKLIAVARAKSKTKSRFSVTPATAALAGLAVVVVATLLFRTTLVRIQPNLSGAFAAIGLPVNVRGLALEGVTPLFDADAERPTLIVTGQIRNLTRSERVIPQLRLAILDTAGKETAILAAAPPQARLNGGATIPFSTRLVLPAGGGERYELRFASDESESLPANH